MHIVFNSDRKKVIGLLLQKHSHC